MWVESRRMKTIFFYLKLVTLLVPAYQVGERNCLRENPGVLDADFPIINRYEELPDLDEKHIANQIALFTTRFKRGHMFFVGTTEWMKHVGDSTSLYNQMTKNNFELFVHLPLRDLPSNVTMGIQLYKDYYQTVKEINAGSGGPIIGLYVGFQKINFVDDLEVFEAVFGPKENSTFRIGAFYYDCVNFLRSKSRIKYLQRMEFITCGSFPTVMSSAEMAADEVIQNCIKMRDIVSSFNITAEFMCTTRYPTFGTTTEGVIGSVSDFQRFWCRIVEQVKMNKKHPQIIMESAFDEPPDDYQKNGTKLNDPKNHIGWWRRRETSSYEATAFVEKVDELEGGWEPGNCTGLCSPCNSDENCCEQTFCELDNSFQPFELGPPPKVCKTLIDTCAPRPPKISSQLTTNPTEVLLVSIPTEASITSTMSTSFPSSQSEPGDSILSYVNISVFILCVLLVVVCAVAFFFYRRRNSKTALTQQELKQFFDGSLSIEGSQTSRLDTKGIIGNLPYNNQWELSAHEFNIREDQFLGCGAFGVVVKGVLGRQEVAVKMTLPEAGKIYLKSLLLELKVLVYLGQHENIVNLLGAHTSQLNSGKLYLFLELCPIGNLLGFLRSQRDNFSDATGCKQIQIEGEDFQVTLKHLLQWSLQIARAMEHLAGKKVVHADIAARNVLVFSTSHVKLTDFGLSRRLYEYMNYFKKGQEPLPWRHMSVEALRDMNFSVQSDVWSFGVTLWEIFSLGNVPYQGHSMSDDFVEFILGGLRLECPKHAHQLIYEVMTSCWKIDAKLRPHISLVKSKLVSAVDELSTGELYSSPLEL